MCFDPTYDTLLVAPPCSVILLPWGERERHTSLASFAPARQAKEEGEGEGRAFLIEFSATHGRGKGGKEGLWKVGLYKKKKKRREKHTEDNKHRRKLGPVGKIDIFNLAAPTIVLQTLQSFWDIFDDFCGLKNHASYMVERSNMKQCNV